MPVLLITGAGRASPPPEIAARGYDVAVNYKTTKNPPPRWSRR
jgi:hypothetical protein